MSRTESALVRLGPEPTRALRLSSRLTHTWRGELMCASLREHPPEIMATAGEGRFWARHGVVVAQSSDATDLETAWAHVEEMSGQEATPPPGASRWRDTGYSYVQLEWTDGADSYLTGVAFAAGAGAVALTYIADSIRGEYMPKNLADPDPECLMAYIEVVLGEVPNGPPPSWRTPLIARDWASPLLADTPDSARLREERP